jgi:hypothetical protein
MNLSGKAVAAMATYRINPDEIWSPTMSSTYRQAWLSSSWAAATAAIMA